MLPSFTLQSYIFLIVLLCTAFLAGFYTHNHVTLIAEEEPQLARLNQTEFPLINPMLDFYAPNTPLQR
jgi:hypothetical protein